MIARNGKAEAARLDDESGPGPAEIEALLPWHAVGRLAPRDARRVEDALGRDPALARQFVVIQDEVAETIHLNESLGAPSARAMQSLMAAIDAEPARTPSASFDLWARVTGFFSSLSPRTLALSASAAAVLLLLQAGVVGTLLMKQPGGNFTVAGYNTASPVGTRALVRFSPDARSSEITALLSRYKASIISGPEADMFRVQFGNTALSKDEAARLLTQVQGEKIVGFAAAAD